MGRDNSVSKVSPGSPMWPSRPLHPYTPTPAACTRVFHCPFLMLLKPPAGVELTGNGLVLGHFSDTYPIPATPIDCDEFFSVKVLRAI
jgi:hypothetical protein